MNIANRISCSGLFLLIMLPGLLVTTPKAIGQELKWKFQTGEKLVVTLEQQTTSNTTVEKRVVKIESLTTLVQDWVVDSIDEKGNFKITQSLQSLQVKVGNPTTPSQTLSLDTSDPTKATGESANLLKQMMPLIGLKYVVSMSPRGEILKVDLNEDSEKILKELPGSIPLQEMFTERGIKELLGASAIVLPSKPVAKGESWETSEPILNPFGEFSRARKYAFEKTEKINDTEFAVFSLTTNLEPKKLIESKKGKMNSFKESGELRMDLAQGRFTSSDIRSVTESETKYMDIQVQTVVENINKMAISAK